ncbi:MAG: histidinol-phosphatase [Acidimicrobiia bacterium]|nr:histidinol-phosphatase [Acidimicrobiia bacterium]
MDLRRELRLALELADAADAVSLPRFRADDLRVETKPDMTPVSEADRDAERAIRDVLERERPAHGVKGEEFGETDGDGRRWILDPIDGTMNYVRGIPVWGSLIALEDDDEIVVGVVSAPAIGHRWWAAKGLGAWRNADPISCSAVSDLGDAMLSYNAWTTAEGCGIGPQMLELERRCWRTRGFGDFWSHMMVAEGAVDVAVEPIAAVWDLAPIKIIVEEAGGRFTGLDGVAAVDCGNALSTNGRLHDEVLEILGSGERVADPDVVP